MYAVLTEKRVPVDDSLVDSIYAVRGLISDGLFLCPSISGGW